jgi:mannose-6-phosphate isomerase-like protein (cupin superfamily)
MLAFETRELIEEQATRENRSLEFLRVPALSRGIDVPPIGSKDTQQQHDEDEVYYVVEGRALITVDREDCPVEAGSLVYVAAHVTHRFHHIEEELNVLVFFATALTEA